MEFIKEETEEEFRVQVEEVQNNPEEDSVKMDKRRRTIE